MSIYKINIKGRDRNYIGRLEKFSDLPTYKQDIFKKIKTEINKHINADVYVFGSHNHGYSDEESDYDVIIFNEKYIDITKQIRDEVGVKVDIMFSKNNTGYVVIP
jgi:predicted nucleotidyltransferase